MTTTAETKPVPRARVEIRIGSADGLIVQVPDADYHQFQIVYQGQVGYHKGEDSAGRWIYRQAREA